MHNNRNREWKRQRGCLRGKQTCDAWSLQGFQKFSWYYWIISSVEIKTHQFDKNYNEADEFEVRVLSTDRLSERPMIYSARAAVCKSRYAWRYNSQISKHPSGAAAAAAAAAPRETKTELHHQWMLHIRNGCSIRSNSSRGSSSSTLWQQFQMYRAEM